MAREYIGVGWHKGPPNDLDMYIQAKIRLLEDEFCIRLTENDISHFRELKTERDVDAYAHQLFMERL